MQPPVVTLDYMTTHRARTASTDLPGSAPRRWDTARAALQTRRSERAAHKVLERELAAYSTPADQAELDAILSRYEPAEIREIQQIVLRTRVAA